MTHRRETRTRRGLLVAAALAVAAAFAVPQAGLAAQPDASEDEPSALTSLLRSELASIERALSSDETPPLTVEVRAGLSAGALRDAVEPFGGAVVEAELGTYWVTMPSGAVEVLDAIDEVSYVTLPARMYEMAVTSEGPDVMSVDQWHEDGLTGSGVKVAVIDSGFTGWAASRSAGELPSGTKTKTKNYCSGGFEQSQHGTAVAETVHDTAPDAKIHLICIETTADMADAIDYVLNNDIDVINMSLGTFNESRGDGSGGLGTSSGQAERAVDAGVVFVSSAGNSGQRHWKGSFEDDDGDGFHEFSGSDESNNITLAPFQTVAVFLKWDKWPTTGLDYDLILKNLDAGMNVATSTDPQTGSQPPIEQLIYTNFTGTTTEFGIRIEKVGGGGSTPRMDLFVTSGSPQHVVSAGSISEPASHPDVLAVGATCWATDVIEPYSSRGPNIAGVKKPEVSAPDGTSTTVYGSANGTCTSGFTGTSAASPHVAGVAALILEAHPGLSPAKVEERLAVHSIDLGASGFDNKYGKGRINGYGLCNDLVPAIIGTDGAETLTGTSSSNVIHGYGGGDTIKGNGGGDTICGGDGSDDLKGGKGGDTLIGGGGNDTLRGDQGGDLLVGGAGSDTASYITSGSGVTANLGSGTASGQGADEFKNVENLTGSPKADILKGDDGSNVLRGDSGPDLLDGKGGGDELFGNRGSDQLLGRSGSDMLTGGEHGDDLSGGKGSDDLRGNAGNDELSGNAGNDALHGGPDTDTLSGGEGTDACSAGETYTSCENIL